MSEVIRGGHGSVGSCPAAWWRLFHSLNVSSVLTSGSTLTPAHPLGSPLGTSGQVIKESGNEKRSPPTLKFSALFKSFILQHPVSISTLPSPRFWLPGDFCHLLRAPRAAGTPFSREHEDHAARTSRNPSRGASSAPCQTLSHPRGQEERAAEAGALLFAARAGAPQHTCRMMDIFLNLESVNRLLFLNYESKHLHNDAAAAAAVPGAKVTLLFCQNLVLFVSTRSPALRLSR